MLAKLKKEDGERTWLLVCNKFLMASICIWIAKTNYPHRGKKNDVYFNNHIQFEIQYRSIMK